MYHVLLFKSRRHLCKGSIGLVLLLYSWYCTGTSLRLRLIGPLQDPVTWYRINYTGTQVTQWDFQNKGKSG